MAVTYRVKVSQVVSVTVDDSKFTSDFMSGFRATMYPFHLLSDHAEHLAQLHTRGIADTGDFIEGYGPSKDMGIELAVERGSVETEVL